MLLSAGDVEKGVLCNGDPLHINMPDFTSDGAITAPPERIAFFAAFFTGFSESFVHSTALCLNLIRALLAGE